MKALIPYLVLAVLSAKSAESAPDPDPLKLARVHAAYAGLDYTVSWRSCGEFNAFYDPETHRVTMCSELLPYGAAVVRMILAHELAHAVITQLDIPYTGSGEAAADELAAVLMSIHGHQEDVLAMADFFKKHPLEVPGWDDHPDNDSRYWMLYRIARGSEVGSRDWHRISRTWARLVLAQ